MLADVDAGSDTPSLVGKVLKWRSEKATEGIGCSIHFPRRNKSFIIFSRSKGAMGHFVASKWTFSSNFDGIERSLL